MARISDLIGKSIEMICINSTQTYFHFGGSEYICALDEYMISEDRTSECRVVNKQVPVNASFLFDCRVRSADLLADGSIRLGLENGSTLSIMKSDRYVESYRYVYDGEEICLEGGMAR